MDYQGGVEVEETEGDLMQKPIPTAPRRVPHPSIPPKVADDGHRDLDAGTAHTPTERPLFRERRTMRLSRGPAPKPLEM